jgi:methionine-rich copper-binding protein CopC
MEVSEYLVGSPAFKAGDTGDPRMAGSIPVHLRQIAVAITACIAVIAMFPTPAAGSARLLSSTPTDGESLEELEQIEFEFDTLLLKSGAEVTVTRLDGTTFEVADTVVDGVTLSVVGPDSLPSGNYSIGFSVRSADGALNEGSIRISIEAPAQSLGGGLIAVIVLALAMAVFVGLVFRADKRRRPRPR